MGVRLDKVEWATLDLAKTVEGGIWIRNFAALHMQCPVCCPVWYDSAIGYFREKTPNSAFHWSRVFEYPWVITNAGLDGTKECLDVGPGHAVFQYAAAAMSRRYVSVDPLVESMTAVQAMKERMNLRSLEVVVADAFDYFKVCPDAAFDIIFCISVLEHVRDWRWMLTEMLRVLRPGGTMLVTLDVRFEGEDPGEFYVGIKEAEDIVRSAGGFLPGAGDETLSWEMGGGIHLRCLGLKIVKESS